MSRISRTFLVPASMWIAALLAGLVSGPAQAHSLKIFVTAQGAQMKGYVYFPGGGKAQDVAVEVLGPDQERVGEVKTDAKGEFTFQVEFQGSYTFVAETKGGHRATYTVPADELPPRLPRPPSAKSHGLQAGKAAEMPQTEGLAKKRARDGPRAPTATDLEMRRTLEEVVGRAVRPLREQIERYEQKVRLHDVLGGIGYIFGIIGILSYLLARRHREEKGK